jgi:hypothetical protein
MGAAPVSNPPELIIFGRMLYRIFSKIYNYFRGVSKLLGAGLSR